MSSTAYRSTVVVIGTAILLAIPLVAMQVTDEVAWTVGDFVFAGAILLGAGLAYVAATRRAGPQAYRWAVGVALAAALLLVWANGAVGLIGDEGNPANLMYGGVLAVGLAGAFVARLRAGGMARALFAAAAAQALVAVVALVYGLGAPVTDAVEIVGTNGVFVLLWIGAGGLFLAAAQEPRPDVEPEV